MVQVPPGGSPGARSRGTVDLQGVSFAPLHGSPARPPPISAPAAPVHAAASSSKARNRWASAVVPSRVRCPQSAGRRCALGRSGWQCRRTHDALVTLSMHKCYVTQETSSIAIEAQNYGHGLQPARHSIRHSDTHNALQRQHRSAVSFAASRAKADPIVVVAHAQPTPPCAIPAPVAPAAKPAAAQANPAPAARPRGSLLASCVVQAAKAQGTALPELGAAAVQVREGRSDSEDPRANKMQLERMNSALLMVRRSTIVLHSHRLCSVRVAEAVHTCCRMHRATQTLACALPRSQHGLL